MNFEFSPEQDQLRDSVRRFLADRASIATHVRPLLDDDRGCDPEIWKGLADLGVIGLLEPSANDRDMVSTGVVLEELGRALSPEPYIASAVGAMAALESTDDAGLLADISSGGRCDRGDPRTIPAVSVDRTDHHREPGSPTVGN